MITFGRPEMLLLMLIVPFVIFVHLISLIGFKKQAFKFANFETLKRLNDDKKNIFSKKIPELVTRLLFVVILCFALAELSIFVEGEGFTEEIIFAVDTSGSMLADDLEPSRLGATKQGLIDFINTQEQNTKIGLISFTSLAYLETEQTHDIEKITASIEELGVKKSRGTSLGTAINFAVALFGENSSRTRKLILFTDGQENVLTNEELIEIIDAAHERNININIVGIGSTQGGPIDEEATGTSVLNENVLNVITEPYDGEYAIANDNAGITEALEEFTDKETVRRRYDLSPWLYLVAFILLISEWYLTNYIFRGFPI